MSYIITSYRPSSSTTEHIVIFTNLGITRTAQMFACFVENKLYGLEEIICVNRPLVAVRFLHKKPYF